MKSNETNHGDNMNIKNVSPDCFQGQYWRGICIATVGGVFRLNFKTTFNYKEEVKQFCKERSGTWDAVTRCWFVPIDKQKLQDGTVNEWVATAIAEFGEGMKIGANIEWCLAGNQDAIPMFEKTCFKQAKKQTLSVVNGGRKSGLEQVVDASKFSKREAELIKSAYQSGQDYLEFARELTELHDMGTQLADALHVAYFLDGKIKEDILEVFAACENSEQPLLNLIAL